ncbi:MAG: response regulator [Lachnospiraceae bacterium]|nr:response regulator [Lachnospiraceae bacterium]
MDTWILFRQTHNQTTQAGAYQLESVSGRMESTISSAEQLTMELAIEARENLSDKKSLEKFIYAQKNEVISSDTDAFNVYIAGSDYTIIPDFDMPDDYNATERVWYTGAIKKHGKPYVSSPYQDAMTGKICYTVSVMLGDEDAVLGVDYTLEGIQNYITLMADNAVNAIIVTDEGYIAGCSDKKMVGKKVVSSMPDYAGIYTSAKTSDSVATGRVKDGFFYENLFATKSGNGWYLIVGISDWELYKNSYVQVAVTMILSLALFAVIIILYLSAMRNRENAEKALESREKFLSNITNELSEPLSLIVTHSSKEYVKENKDYEDEMASIHKAGKRLSEMMEQIMSYNSIVSTYKIEKNKTKTKKTRSINKRFRSIIMIIMFLAMFLSLYTNILSSYRWGNTQTEKEAEKYEYQLSEWINTQKSILDMFVSVISTHPEMMDDYEGTVEYLKNITEQYPEISVTYMTNPDLEHTVYMSNGWEPDEGWKVEERQWYIDTSKSDKGWSISDPYFDDQTGGYCVTISEMVYDAKTGEFLGIFGIDFFMDKLVQILGDSYSKNGYAFLVDPEGEIINHPYGKYQMTQHKAKNVNSLPYAEIRPDDEKGHIIKDYDGTHKILYASRNEESSFTVYVVSNVWKVYAHVIILVILCLVTFLLCIFMVYKLITDFINIQAKTNEQLSEAADAAIAAGKAKSQFLAQMSHEIRTPINAVLGMNEMIIRESDDEDIKDYAKSIRSSGRTLLSLINSILDFSKIEDGKMKVVPVKYSVLSLINDLENSISERAKAKKLELILQIDESLPSTLYGDDVRIRQVIMNLLTNAVKYTEEGQVTLKMWTKKREGDSFTLQVFVKDTGIGIREEDKKKMFESFSRLDEIRNRNIEGTGLGMSVVTKLLEMMGSSLQMESEYGKGSTFYFEIDQKIINEEPIGKYEERMSHSEEGDREEEYLYVKDANVLLVDDNELNLKVARNLMKRNGIVPDEAMSGVETIEKMRYKKYDIVFLDHMMPKMDGIETLDQLKKEKLIPKGCTVIALTANAISGSKDKYLEAGFDDYLTKPIDVVQMEKKLSVWLPDEKTEWRKIEEKHENKHEKKGSDDEIFEFDSVGDDDEVFEFDSVGDGNDEIFEFKSESELNDTSELNNVSDANYKSDFNDKNSLNQTQIDKLRAIGLDTEKALGFCSGETEFYMELVTDYVEDYKERIKALSKACDTENWYDFEVKIHGLKSISATIGANNLAEKALELEKAAESENARYVIEKYHEFEKDYKDLIGKIKTVFED